MGAPRFAEHLKECVIGVLSAVAVGFAAIGHGGDLEALQRAGHDASLEC